jgi:two-component sensor histidine kinase
MSISGSDTRVVELEAELAAKELELSEANARYGELRHRIGNALQVLAIIMTRQARTAKQPDYCEQCIKRLSHATTLYNMLDNDGSDRIAMARQLKGISDMLKGAFASGHEIITVVSPEIELDHHRAQCVGLIYAEAAMNALKHAFPNNADGRIEMNFRRAGENFEMTVSDDGVGFNSTLEQAGHGLKFMRDLACHLKGDLELQRLPIGSLVRVTFPVA